MSAPVGNQFWKLRSKHGRDKLFTTPELLWEAACEYFEWCDENPFHKREAKSVSGGGREPGSIETVDLPVMRPYTLQGLCIYLDCNTKYFNDLADANHEGFSEVITRIREVIYNQKFSGAASGFFNANIIARDLGLADKKDVEKTVKHIDFKDAE
jgi:hypothetical protein